MPTYGGAIPPSGNGDPAQLLVNNGWQFIKGEAGSLASQATALLNGIKSAYAVGPAPVITFTPPEINVGTFTRPLRPDDPVIANVAVSVPSAPTPNGITLDALPAAPTEPDFSGIVYSKPAAPNTPMPNAPSDTDVALAEVNIPDAPVLVMPDMPDLYDLVLPTVPNLVIPAFQGVRPVMNLVAPSAGLQWQYQAFDKSFINTIRGQLSAMTINGLALPPHIEQAIFDRLRGREDVLTLQATQEAATTLAASGLRQPAGLLLRAVRRVTDAARMRTSAASSDLGIEIARQNVESIKFGISQGIAMESAMYQNHIAEQGMLLDAAKAILAATMEAFNAQVTLHNAQWEGFKAEAQVFESLLKGVSAQVDIYKSQVEAAKAIGDVNESLVRAYGERVRSLSAITDMYRAQVDGAKAKGEINVQRLEQVRLRIQGYSALVDAWGKQWDAFKSQTEAEAQGLRYFETMGSIYGQRVNAWKGQVEAQDTRVRSQIAIEGQAIESFRGALAGVATELQAQTVNVEAATRIFGSKAQMYAAEGQVSAAESESNTRAGSLMLDGARLEFDAAATNAKNATDFALKVGDQGIEASRGAAQIWAQLASSVYSGMNFSAGIGYNESMSWSYSGEI